MTSVPVADLANEQRGKSIESCAFERLVQTIPLMIAMTSQRDILTVARRSSSNHYGGEAYLLGCKILTCIGFLGRVAYDEDERVLAERAHSCLVALGPQEERTLERGRLIGLAILGDWVGLLSGLRSGDRRMLAAAMNAIRIWHDGAPYTPAWATDLEAVGTWIINHLASDDESLAPDVRSTLSEIKDWIEQQIGRNIAPPDAA
ncbi:hypothetical protein [Dactylosporangium cerinum]